MSKNEPDGVLSWRSRWTERWIHWSSWKRRNTLQRKYCTWQSPASYIHEEDLTTAYLSLRTKGRRLFRISYNCRGRIFGICSLKHCWMESWIYNRESEEADVSCKILLKANVIFLISVYTLKIRLTIEASKAEREWLLLLLERRETLEWTKWIYWEILSIRNKEETWLNE